MGMESGPKGPPQIEWTCSSCKKINSPKASVCSSCGKKK